VADRRAQGSPGQPSRSATLHLRERNRNHRSEPWRSSPKRTGQSGCGTNVEAKARKVPRVALAFRLANAPTVGCHRVRRRKQAPRGSVRESSLGGGAQKPGAAFAPGPLTFNRNRSACQPSPPSRIVRALTALARCVPERLTAWVAGRSGALLAPDPRENHRIIGVRSGPRPRWSRSRAVRSCQRGPQPGRATHRPGWRSGKTKPSPALPRPASCRFAEHAAGRWSALPSVATALARVSVLIRGLVAATSRARSGPPVLAGPAPCAPRRLARAQRRGRAAPPCCARAGFPRRVQVAGLAETFIGVARPASPGSACALRLSAQCSARVIRATFAGRPMRPQKRKARPHGASPRPVSPRAVAPRRAARASYRRRGQKARRLSGARKNARALIGPAARSGAPGVVPAKVRAGNSPRHAGALAPALRRFGNTAISRHGAAHGRTPEGARAAQPCWTGAARHAPNQRAGCCLGFCEKKEIRNQRAPRDTISDSVAKLRGWLRSHRPVESRSCRARGGDPRRRRVFFLLPARASHR
jgi:hypothetical protein